MLFLMTSRPPFLQMFANDFPHFMLLRFDGTGGINYCQPEFFDHAIVLTEDLSLEDRKALFRIVRPLHIETGFIVFQRRSAGQNAIDCHVEWRAKEEQHSWA